MDLKRKHMTRRLFFFLQLASLVILCSLLIPIPAKAYTSWVQDNPSYGGLYGGTYSDDEGNTGDSSVSTKSDQVKDESDPTKNDTLTKLLSNFFGSISVSLHNLLESPGELSFSIDGIILGRLQGTPVSYTTFELVDGNIYGYAASVFYRSLRAISYSLMFVVFLLIIWNAAIHKGPQSLMMLKDSTYTLVLMYLLLYLMPHLADIALYFRDNVLSFLLVSLTRLEGANFSEGIIGAYAKTFMEKPGIFSSILYLAACVSSVFFLGSYVKLAVTQMAFFGAFPTIAVLSVKDKKLFSNWCSQFFSNMFIPVVDLFLFLVPNMIMSTLYDDHPIVAGLIVVLLITSIMPLRSAVMQLFGNVTGVQMGRGAGGLAALGGLAFAAARNMRRGSSGGHSNAEGSGGREDHNSDLLNAERNTQLGENLDEGGATFASHQKELQDIDSMYGNSSQSSYGASGYESMNMDNEGYSMGGENGSFSDTSSLYEASESGTIEYPNYADVSSESGSYSSSDDGLSGAELNQEQNALYGNNLNNFEQMRYKNLEALDSASGRMSNLKQEQYGLEKDITKVDRDIASRDEAGISLSDSTDGDLSMAEHTSERQNVSEESDYSLEQMRAEKEQQLMNNKNEQNNVQKEIAARKEAEQGMAQTVEASGGSGRTYQNAASFERQKQIDDIKKRQANYRNFDSKDYQGVLSPQEKADYYRERARHNTKAVRIAKGALKAGGAVALGSAAAGVMMFGGTQAMQTAGMAGAYGGYKVGEAIGNKVVDDVVDRGPELKAHLESNIDLGNIKDYSNDADFEAADKRKESSPKKDNSSIPELDDLAHRGTRHL